MSLNVASVFSEKKSLGILRYKQNEEFLRLHVCCICLEIFKVAIFHQGLDCQTLRSIDEKVEFEKQQSFIKSLNENAQIRSQK